MSVRSSYVQAAEAALGAVGDGRVAERWAQPSALVGYTVGGLCAHLARAGCWVVEEYLDGDEPAAGARLVTAAEYYAAAPSDPADPGATAVRERGERAAAPGHAVVAERTRRVVGRLAGRLPTEPAGRRVAVVGGVPMALDEYLLTRLAELVVHGDDLAVSVGAPWSAPPPEVARLVAATALDVARVRHGDLAVLRALFRRERQALEVLRVF